MLNNIYSPLSGGLAQQQLLDIIANNLANVNTTAYKEDHVTFKFLPPEPYEHYKNPLLPAQYKDPEADWYPLVGNELGYVGISGIARNTHQGPAIKTDNPLDFMIEGDGFLTVQTLEGLRYSRDGSLSLSDNGALVTKEGHPVLGEKGNIFIRHGDFSVNHLGEIYQDGEYIDRLLIQSISVDDANLSRVGSNMFFYGGPTEDVKQLPFANIKQGFIEGSNVNIMKNLTAMITAHRSYEAYQKALANYDHMMEKGNNQLGNVPA